MANWDDITNNCLAMGRSRWLCYRLNEQRRRQEQEGLEGRLGVRHVGTGRGESESWEQLPRENFNRHG